MPPPLVCCPHPIHVLHRSSLSLYSWPFFHWRRRHLRVDQPGADGKRRLYVAKSGRRQCHLTGVSKTDGAHVSAGAGRRGQRAEDGRQWPPLRLIAGAAGGDDPVEPPWPRRHRRRDSRGLTAEGSQALLTSPSYLAVSLVVRAAAGRGSGLPDAGSRLRRFVEFGEPSPYAEAIVARLQEACQGCGRRRPRRWA